MIQLELHRHFCNKDCIRGSLFVVQSGINGSAFHLCETLEPSPHCLLSSGTDGSKFYPAIENGTYNLSVTYSPKFKCNLPLLSVDGRQGIRIHAGNNAFDTSGCILVGVLGNLSSLSYSRIALRFVMDVIKACGISSIKIITPLKLF